MKTLQQAWRIYEECLDMDYMDYMDFQESDIAHIEATIKRIGYRATRRLYLAIVRGEV